MTNGENSIYSVSPSPNVSLLPAAALPQRPQHPLLSPQHRRIRCTSFPNTRSTGVAANRETGRLPQHNRAPDCPAHGLSTQDNNKVLSDGDESDTMSVLLSISSILSLLTFLTTVLALVRVGTAAFASNQPFKQQAPGISMQPLRLQWAGDGMSLSKAMRLGMKDAREEERANGAELENGYLGAGAPLLRMSSVGMLSPSGRPPSPYPRINVPAPISMAKLIISRQNKRKPGRVSVRRPPGLPTSTMPPSRSRLVEQIS